MSGTLPTEAPAGQDRGAIRTYRSAVVAAELKDLRLRLLGMVSAWGELMEQGEDSVASSKWLIESFRCMESQLYKREVCGVNALASFNRADFGVNVNLDMGFKPEIKLAIQAEGIIKVD